MKWIIPTCDKYANIIEANKFTTDKYGGSGLDVTVLGFKKPEFDMGNWKFVNLGQDRGPKEFSNDLIRYFNDFNDEFFIYGNDDVVMTDKLDLPLLADLEQLMKNDPAIGRIWITSASIKNHRIYSVYQDNPTYRVIEIPQAADYRLSLHYSIWRTSYFKKYLVPNISPWEWELRTVAKNDGAKILTTLGRHVIDFGHIFRNNRGATDNWHFSEYTGKALSPQDKEFVDRCILKTIAR